MNAKSGLKPKHQRLLLAVLALAALIGAGLLAARALSEEASFFYTPTTLAKEKPAIGRAIRIGGMVKPGSIQRGADGITVRFIVQDKDASLTVRYTGITPDLFVEGSGVVADGRLADDGAFVADNLLAKHDENYVPKELADIDMNAAQHSQDSLVQ
ncbi:cytochrome c maturation protein CcmE [Sphingorhabdus arenilitoris]|uniref:Cytochrome c-type biogenesis protein CcmE n=1 Tax=Sphingorhabdus arenilitoris TaxID=1490041 RepID=A0ABV8RF74_9SPHN